MIVCECLSLSLSLCLSLWCRSLGLLGLRGAMFCFGPLAGLAGCVAVAVGTAAAAAAAVVVAAATAAAIGRRWRIRVSGCSHTSCTSPSAFETTNWAP